MYHSIRGKIFYRNKTNIHLNSLSPILERDYEVGGTTALLDAIGFTIQKIANAQKYTGEDERANHVLFVITTDGMENASREFTSTEIYKTILNYEMVSEAVVKLRSGKKLNRSWKEEIERYYQKRS